jgi:hypothetical protein
MIFRFSIDLHLNLNENYEFQVVSKNVLRGFLGFLVFYVHYSILCRGLLVSNPGLLRIEPRPVARSNPELPQEVKILNYGATFSAIRLGNPI